MFIVWLLLVIIECRQFNFRYLQIEIEPFLVLLHMITSYHYFAPGRGGKYCDKYVCVSAHITQKPHGQSSAIFFLLVAYGHDLVLLWQCCDIIIIIIIFIIKIVQSHMLCTSGFMDNVRFLYYKAIGQ